MVHHSLAEEVPSYFSSASDFLNSSRSQLIRIHRNIITVITD